MNVFLRAARGRFVIICHQDVELISDGRRELDARLAELESADSLWGLAGNAGGRHKRGLSDLAIRISDPHGRDVARGPFPSRVSAIDENFVIVKAKANLCTSGDMNGFHLYAMDMSIIASILGYRAYVIDFHLRHKSPGRVREGSALLAGEIGFQEVKRQLARKYRLAFAPVWYSSSATEVLIWPKMRVNMIYNLWELIKLKGIASFYRRRMANDARGVRRTFRRKTRT
jgi:hypothetical protein